MLSILIAAPLLGRVPGLATVGRVSLQIFLIHGLVFSVLRIVVNRLSVPLEMHVVVGGVTLAITVLVSTGWGLFTERSPTLTRFLFPRDLASWLGRRAS